MVLKEGKVRGGPLATWVQELSHFMAELESCGLEPEIPSWRDLQDEPKVDVYKVAHCIHKNIAIVPIFGLKQIARNCVPALGQLA